ncbi:MAG TPA: hypothetical protein VE954_35475 [Oligoflexus sp.]|uniref:hypothetical protein n=1 Tax=Oligoflexus sp. TaxID=1971216 RepID=UPI002D320036|nr:hypothetical protein [Oligoflexus sp.]HYX38434.1 hypothetical protein [Oligoflexus sp.]
MRGLKCLLMAALVLSASTEAATTLSPTASPLVKIETLRIDPALLRLGFTSCSNHNVEAFDVKAVDLDETIFEIKVKFKNFILKESGSDVVSLACSLYSKLPTSSGGATQVMKIVSSRFNIQTHTPKTVKGHANFGVGVVDVGGLAFSGEYHLAPGVAAGMEGTTRMASAHSTALRRTTPTPDLRKITHTGFGSASSLATDGPRPVDVDFSRTINMVNEDQYIVQQIYFSIQGNQGDKLAWVQLHDLVLVLESAVM